jgi:endogenous inhibitor of DNA gyrase (YacG/DUF329 family)
MAKTVNCPTCRRPVPWEPASTWRPFCSERCQLIDFGDWIDESHRISEPTDGYRPDAEPGDGGEGSGPH